MPTRTLAQHLAPRLVTQHDLCNNAPTGDPGALLANLSGDFAEAVTALFPGDWAWAALATPLPTRQIWYAVLSGLPALPPDPATLRTNLLILDHKHLLRLRFQGLAEPMHGILTRLFPAPLPRDTYTMLADRLAKDPSLIAWYAGQAGEVNSVELAGYFED